MNAFPQTVIVRPAEFSAAARYLGELCLIGTAYFLLAKFGLTLASINPSATPIWPPTGLAIAVVLLRGYGVWPAILLGAFLANATTAGSISTSLAIGIGNSLEGVIGGMLINRWAGGPDAFATPANVTKYAVFCFLPTALSATIGVGSLSIAGYANWASFKTIWLTWWLGDLAGALVIAPVIVLWARGDWRTPRQALSAESALVFACVCAIGIVAFSPLIEQTASRAPLGFISILPLLWAALRLGQRDTATVALILSCFAVWGTFFNGGPFARVDLNDSFLLLLMFMVSTAVPSLALSADVDNLRKARGEMEQRVQQRTVALELAREQLAQAQKLEAIGQLTGGIAHDFNNLLMIVSGHAQMMQRRLTEPKDLQAIDAIQVAAKRGQNLTRQLLTFSRRQQINPVVIEVKARIDGVREMLGSSLRGNIELAVEVPSDIWPVEVDVSELELALVNVAVNARDAMPNGGIVRLSARNVAFAADTPGVQLAGEYVALAVTDSGSGIPPDVVGKIFEPFFTTKAVGKGTGLGLAQVYGFARQAGGDVAVTSELGAGTTITIYLPRSNAVVAVEPDENVRRMRRQRGTVLVVEDDHEVGTATASMIEQIGFRVERVNDANDALQLLGRGRKFDLVFSDIVMPGGISGVALARVISERYPQIRVLLTTGYNDTDSNAEPSFPILRKPFELSALQTALRQAMARSRQAPGRRASRRSAP